MYMSAPTRAWERACISMRVFSFSGYRSVRERMVKSGVVFRELDVKLPWSVAVSLAVQDVVWLVG